MIKLSHVIPFKTALSGVLIVLFAAPLVGREGDSAVAPIQVLYVTGGGYHDYEGQEKVLSEVLSARIHLEWTVDFEAGGSNSHRLTRFAKEGWHEPYDVVIYNMCFASVRDVDYIEGIARAHHETGTAAMIIHCSMHTFRDADTREWNRLIGLRSYHHEHQQREVDVSAMAPEHPIMTGFPKGGWLSPRDEIYIIEEVFENTVPLALAYGVETERHHPVMWTNEYGKARVVGTTAGHNNSVVAHPVFLDFIARGLLWSVEKLDDNGEPAAGYAGPNPSFTLEPGGHEGE